MQVVRAQETCNHRRISPFGNGIETVFSTANACGLHPGAYIYWPSHLRASLSAHTLSMKLSTPTLFAILATSAVVGAAPTEIQSAGDSSTFLVKKSDVTDVLSIIQELGLLNQKREFIEDENELAELSKRADSVLGELLSALASSGIIGDVWNILTTDTALRTEIVALVKSSIQGLITAAPSLITAVWNSGLLQKIFSDIWNDAALKTALFDVAKAIFSSGLNLLKTFLANRSGSSTTTTAAATTTTAAAKREIVNFNPEEYYDKRDLLTVAEQVVTAIKNTGIVQSLIQKALADPSASISFLSSVFSKGLVLAEDVYSWSKSSGLLLKALAWIAANGPTYAADVAEFLGNQIVSGNATVSQIDNASSSVATTTTSTTATSTATTLYKRRLY